jgi:hypothetical protein
VGVLGRLRDPQTAQMGARAARCGEAGRRGRARRRERGAARARARTRARACGSAHLSCAGKRRRETLPEGRCLGKLLLDVGVSVNRFVELSSLKLRNPLPGQATGEGEEADPLAGVPLGTESRETGN